MTSCTAADNVSLELPPMIIDMLMNREFKPDPRSELASLLNVKVRSQITTRNLEESPTISLAHILAKIIGNDSRTQDESQGDSEVVQRYSTLRYVTQYDRICLAAKEALMDLCSIPTLMRLPNKVLETTDIAVNNKFKLHLNIKSFELLKKQPDKYVDYFLFCDFCKIVYIRGSPGGINHTRKVKEYPDVRHISYEEIKSRLFVNISEVFICFQRIVNDYPIAQLYLKLDFIHKQEIIHRDFHSGNILIENESDIVTSDLGISKLSTDSSDDERNYYGIMPYIAPEIFQGKECNTYTKAADIYSFGMIMWELMNGKRPFEDRDCDTDLMIQIIDGARPPIVTNAPEGYIELMQQCWDSDPNKRPTSRDIFKLINEK
ncbi:18334_t:CDS:2 [Funneliformis geosporum]|uniref:18334_t:CDS:1 n=1 Tax=Funneliformis geosporum TaxID=1117311 RepID=A0A9W4SK32_9GLOM|nr:18334_t:CDS:2 [Funneliformis geosporum]